MNLRMGWGAKGPFTAASKLAGPTAAASCAQSTGPEKFPHRGFDIGTSVWDTPPMYETSGKLKWIGEVQSFASGFTKREFVVTTAADKYPQDLKFEIVKDRCALLDPFEVGQDVDVSFDIRGNEYNGKYFVNLSCWKIQMAGAAAAAPPAQARRAAPRAAGGAAGPEPSPEDLRSGGDFDDEPPF
jgi:hypothetical protein